MCPPGAGSAERAAQGAALLTHSNMKYVLVTGGVVSGLGKGVTASSIGVILKHCGHRVTSIKIGMRSGSWLRLIRVCRPAAAAQTLSFDP